MRRHLSSNEDSTVGHGLLRPIHDRQLRESAEGLAVCALHKVSNVWNTLPQVVHRNKSPLMSKRVRSEEKLFCTDHMVAHPVEGRENEIPPL